MGGQGWHAHTDCAMLVHLGEKEGDGMSSDGSNALRTTNVGSNLVLCKGTDEKRVCAVGALLILPA